MKRICLLLDKNLQEIFTKEANQRGITKSSLLKQLILAKHTVYVNYTSSQKKNILYNFRIKEHLYQKLMSDCAYFNVSVGEYLRNLIYQSSVKSKRPEEPPQNNLLNLWRGGKYSAINELYPNPERLSNIELLHYANANLETGRNKRAMQTLDLLDTRLKTIEPQERIKFTKISHLIKADMAIRNRNLVSAQKHLEIAGNIVLDPIIRTYWGYYYCLMGEIAEYKDQIDLSFKYYERALEYFDIVNHAWFMMRVYIRIARGWKYKAQYKNARYYLMRAFEINRKVNNIYYDAWNHMDLSFYLFVTRELESSISNTQKAMQLYSSAGNIRGSYYGLDNLGRVELEKGNLDQSYKFFTKAREIERTFRPKDSMSSTDFYLSFIEAKDNYQKSKRNFEEYAKGEKADIWPTFHKYFQGATQYIYAPTSKEKEAGAIKLKELSHESQNVLIAAAASNTLKHKRVMPIR